MTPGTFAAALTALYALSGLWVTHDAANRWAVAIAFAVAVSGAADKALTPWAAPPPLPAPSTDQNNGRPAATTAPDADPPTARTRIRPTARTRIRPTARTRIRPARCYCRPPDGGG